MNEPLPLPERPVSAKQASKYACSVCGVVDTDGTHGPGEVRRWNDWHYKHYPGPWLCTKHSKAVWGLYLERVKLRLDVIRESNEAGWPLSMTQYRERKQAQRDRGRVQLTLLEGGRSGTT